MNSEAWTWITIALLFATNVFSAMIGINRYHQIVDTQEELCVLCPDKEEKECEEDKWELGYVLEHCYEKDQK